MKNDLSSNKKISKIINQKTSFIILSLLAIIGIILYVLVVFSFDLDETTFDSTFYLICPLFFVSILGSGIYSINYFNKVINYNLSFGITRKTSLMKYIKNICFLLLVLIIISFVYFLTIFLHLLFKGLEFSKILNIIYIIFKNEMLIDVICYYVFCNGIIALISNVIKNNSKYTEHIITTSYVLIILSMFILNITLEILNGNILYNLLFLIIGILLFIINYIYTMKKEY